MPAVLQMRRMIRRDHQLHLDLTLPPDFPEGEVEITVRSATPATAPATGMSEPGISDLNALFAYLDQLPPGTRSKQEIDRDVADERDSWN